MIVRRALAAGIITKLGCADAPPCSDEQDASEKVRLHVEQIEAGHVPGRVDAAKVHVSGTGSCRRQPFLDVDLPGRHVLSLDMVAMLTL